MKKQKTKITKIKGDWKEVVDDCRSTAGKESLGHEPSESFKRVILIAEHSPIRDIHVKWKWDKIESFVATHFSRHMWECFIKSQRSDRTGIPRRKLPQDAPVTFTGDANIQNLIDTWRKRLCYKASPETREYAEDFKETLYDIEPEIADVLVPNCVYRGFCPEPNPCGFWYALIAHMTMDYLTDGQKRYTVYNNYFKSHRENIGCVDEIEVSDNRKS